MAKKISMKNMLNDKYNNFVPSQKMMELEFMDTNIPTINYLISGRPLTGGLPLSGKITTLYGVEACLADTTFISYDLRSKQTGKRFNKKGGTVAHLYERFHNICKDGRANKIDWENTIFYINSIDESTNRIIRQPIADVVKTGTQECFEVITKNYGKRIETTANHKYYVGNGEYKELSELKVGDKVYIHDNITNKKEHKKDNRKYVNVKYLPNGWTKVINGVTYYSERISVLTYEAYINNMEYSDFIALLNDTSKKDYIDTLKFVDKTKYDIHHIDKNPDNNDISNLQLIEKSEHYRLHANENIENLSFIVVEDEIASIKSVGMRDTYDIKCFEPFNNYIADGIVVHNCGKTTLIGHVMRQALQKEIDVVFFDTESSVTNRRLEQFGIDPDDEHFMLYMPDTMENVFDMIDTIYDFRLSKGLQDEPCIIVWDSVAGTATQEMVERKADQKEIGSEAKVLARGLKRVRPKLRKMNAGFVLINQARANTDMYGDLFKMPGGYALYHMSDLIIRVNKLKQTEDGMTVKFTTPVKNRLFSPFQNTLIQFDYTHGYTREAIITSFCEFLKSIGILGSAGSYCYLSSDIDKLMKENNISEEEAKKQVKKFYLKDFSAQLAENNEYFNELRKYSEEYVNKHISHVTSVLHDEEAEQLGTTMAQQADSHKAEFEEE